MRKSALFIAFAAPLALWACDGGGKNNGGSRNNGGGDEPPVTGQSVDSETVKSKLAFEKQLLIAAVPFNGPILYQRGEEKVGPEAELGRAIHARIQEELGDDIRLVWVNKTAYGSLINSVARGDQHLGMGVLGITDERKRSVDFSESYYSSRLVVAYNPVIKVVDSRNLSGHKVGVRAGTAAAAFVKENYSDSTIVEEETSDDLVLALRSGALDAIIDDRLLLSFSLATVTGMKTLEIDEAVLAEIPVGIAIPKGSDWMRDIIDEVIAEAQGPDGQLASWMDEHITDEIKAVDRRDDRREAQQRAARLPRTVIVRVSKDPALEFDIFRLANLPFTFRDTESGQTYTSSRLNFQGRTGVASVKVPPATYRFSLQKWEPISGSVQITPRDSERVTVNVRLNANNTVTTTRN